MLIFNQNISTSALNASPIHVINKITLSSHWKFFREARTRKLDYTNISTIKTYN